MIRNGLVEIRPLHCVYGTVGTVSPSWCGTDGHGPPRRGERWRRCYIIHTQPPPHNVPHTLVEDLPPAPLEIAHGAAQLDASKVGPDPATFTPSPSVLV